MNLFRMAFGHTTTQILYAAVRLGVPDALADGAMPADKLAHALDCDPDGLTRLLRALVVLGVVEEVPPAHFVLAGAARPLCADHPRSMRSGVLLLGDPATWRAWGALTEGVRTGGPAFDHAHGTGLFDYLADHPDLSVVFNKAMRDGTSWVAPAVARAYDFSAAGTVVDVGGGNGALLAAVLDAAPAARGILFDTAEGTVDAEQTLARPGLAARYEIETGSFFDAVPAGDVLMVKGILHDWDDQRCLTVLRNCRAAIAPGGHLLVVEPVRPDRLDTAEAAEVVMSDIAMLVYTGGRERSRPEYETLLASAGFTLVGVTPPLAGSATRILIAKPRPMEPIQGPRNPPS
jgi:SAM-dependent methyltransferase